MGEEKGEVKFNEISEDETPETKSKGRLLFDFLKETAFIIVVAFLISLVIRFFVVEAFNIQQHSMEPTLHDGERVLVSKFIYRFTPVSYGDIIILKSPMNTSDFVKRVIATEGETVESKEGELLINGKAIEEPYIKFVDLSNYGPVEVPENEIFVAGDNRPNSLDSRIFGPIPEDNVVGKVFFIYWPVDRIGFVK